MANNLTAFPRYVDTAASLSTTHDTIRKVVWYGATTANHKLVISGKNGQVKIGASAKVGDTVILDFFDEPLTAADGFTVTTIDSGVALIY